MFPFVWLNFFLSFFFLSTERMTHDRSRKLGRLRRLEEKRGGVEIQVAPELMRHSHGQVINRALDDNRV